MRSDDHYVSSGSVVGRGGPDAGVFEQRKTPLVSSELKIGSEPLAQVTIKRVRMLPRRLVFESNHHVDIASDLHALVAFPLREQGRLHGPKNAPLPRKASIGSIP